MSMPIQRQSEQFSIFDDGPRYARDRSSTDLPQGLAGLINSTGPRIQAGLLNTRTAGYPGGYHDNDVLEQDDVEYQLSFEPGYERQNTAEDARRNYFDKAEKSRRGLASREAAGYDFGRGPRDHGGAGPDGGPSVPDWYYDGDSEDEEDDPLFGQDPDRFVPEHLVHGHRQASRRPFDRTAAHCPECDQPCDVEIEGHGYEEKYQEFPVSDCCGAELDDDGPDPDRDYDTWKDDQILDHDWHEGSLRPFDRAAAGRLAQARRVALAPAPAPQDPAMAPQMPVGGGFLPAHRVGLEFRPGNTIPGTVIANDGQVHIRWDDGQYTSEDPSEVHLL